MARQNKTITFIGLKEATYFSYMKKSIIIGIISTLLLYGMKVSSQTRSVSTTASSWKIGVALYSFKASLSEASKVGAKYVEGFSFQKLGSDFDDVPVLELSDAQIGKMNKLQQEQGVTMVSMYAAAKSRAEWEKYFNIGSKLHLKFLVGEPEPEDLDFIDRLAGKYKMRLAIHNHAKNESKYWDPSYLLSILKGKRNIGVCADLGHWARSNMNPVDNLKKLEGHILSIHAKNVEGAESGHTKWTNINEGIIDYRLVTQELQRQHFKGLVYIEDERRGKDNSEDVKSALAYLKQISVSN